MWLLSWSLRERDGFHLWDAVVIDSFTISLLTAILLQVLLKATLAIERRIATYFEARPGRSSLILRILATWLVLLGSKFVILEIVDAFRVRTDVPVRPSGPGPRGPGHRRFVARSPGDGVHRTGRVG